MTVYILIAVSFDWYRFQDNQGVFLSLQDAVLAAKNEDDSLEIVIPNDLEAYKKMEVCEQVHWYIEEWKI
jgi:hypothetical protein